MKKNAKTKPLDRPFRDIIQYFKDLNGQEIDGNNILEQGSFLHEDTENMSEQESAKFERDDAATFKIVRFVNDELLQKMDKIRKKAQ